MNRLQVFFCSPAPKKKLEQIHDFKQSVLDHQAPEGNQYDISVWPNPRTNPIDSSGLLKFRNPWLVTLPHGT
jgi:hypothetical protein